MSTVYRKKSINKCYKSVNSTISITLQQPLLPFINLYYPSATSITLHQSPLPFSNLYYPSATSITLQQSPLPFSNLYYPSATSITHLLYLAPVRKLCRDSPGGRVLYLRTVNINTITSWHCSCRQMHCPKVMYSNQCKYIVRVAYRIAGTEEDLQRTAAGIRAATQGKYSCNHIPPSTYQTAFSSSSFHDSWALCRPLEHWTSATN